MPDRDRCRIRRLLCALVLLCSAPAALPALFVVRPSPAGAALPAVQAWLTDPDGSAQLTPQPDVALGTVHRGSADIEVDDNQSYQTMVGFGAAFTDSSAYLLMQLKAVNPDRYATLMNQIFSPITGDGLSFWRVPMTATDFNAADVMWSDDDTPGSSADPTRNFALTSQDTSRIIPVIKDALAINPNLKLVASAWSAPAWMKSNGSMICDTGSGPGTLLPQYRQAWADYHVKWIQAYQARGIPIWAITPQNEPGWCPTTYPGMSWDEPTMAAWVHDYLKPSLASAGLAPRLLGYDFNWDDRTYPTQLVTGPTGADYDGVAWHCYDQGAEPAMMTALHNAYGADQYETECSSTSTPINIIRYTTAQMSLLSAQNWAKGVILWNLALDGSGGPCLGCNGSFPAVPVVRIDTTTDGAGTVTDAQDTLLDNYYQLGQLSRFVMPGAVRIHATTNAAGIYAAAFRNPDGGEALIATNTNSVSTAFTVTWNRQGSFDYTLPPGATVTFRGSLPAAPAVRTTPLGGQTYRIVSRVSGKPLGVANGSTGDGAAVVTWTDDGAADQQWTLRAVDGTYYTVVNVKSGKVLDVPGGSTAAGTQLQQWSPTGNANQLWRAVAVGGGHYSLLNRASGQALDLSGSGLGDGTPAQQWTASSTNLNQQWDLVAVPPAALPAVLIVGGTYRIVSAVTGKPIAVDGASTADAAPILEWADDAGLDQLWTVDDAGGGFVNLVNAGSGKALDLPGGSAIDGTQLQQYTLTGSGNANQQWQLTTTGAGYSILNRGTGKAVDLRGASSDDGTSIQQWTATGGDADQSWTFVPAG